MLDSITKMFSGAAVFLQKLNSTSIKRIVIYLIIVYPLFFTVIYKDEVLEIFTSNKDNQVKVRKLETSKKRCFKLRELYNAEAVMFYVYQPNSSIQTTKQRVAMSLGLKYNPLDANENIQLLTRTKVLEGFKSNGFSKITKTSKHAMSTILFEYGLDVAYVIPVHSITSNRIVGEVVYIFENDQNINIAALIVSAQMFAYDL